MGNPLHSWFKKLWSVGQKMLHPGNIILFSDGFIKLQAVQANVPVSWKWLEITQVSMVMAGKVKLQLKLSGYGYAAIQLKL